MVKNNLATVIGTLKIGKEVLEIKKDRFGVLPLDKDYKTVISRYLANSLKNSVNSSDIDGIAKEIIETYDFSQKPFISSLTYLFIKQNGLGGKEAFNQLISENSNEYTFEFDENDFGLSNAISESDDLKELVFNKVSENFNKKTYDDKKVQQLLNVSSNLSEFYQKVFQNYQVKSNEFEGTNNLSEEQEEVYDLIEERRDDVSLNLETFNALSNRNARIYNDLRENEFSDELQEELYQKALSKIKNLFISNSADLISKNKDFITNEIARFCVKNMMKKQDGIELEKYYELLKLMKNDVKEDSPVYGNIQNSFQLLDGFVNSADIYSTKSSEPQNQGGRKL